MARGEQGFLSPWIVNREESWAVMSVPIRSGTAVLSKRFSSNNLKASHKIRSGRIFCKSGMKNFFVVLFLELNEFVPFFVAACLF